jgi:3-oxoadipate enol-lactonase
VAATTPAGYLGCAAAIIKFDVQQKLPSVKTPTLVVCGDDDPSTPPAGNKKIAELIPGARYQEIADARHISMVEQPDIFNRIMQDWLSSMR